MRSAPKLPNVAGPGVAAPGIRQFGTPEQIDRLLVPLLRGDEWWALGMSEPEAGSDFAGLRTRAVRDGECSGSRAERSGPPRPTCRAGARCMPAPIRTRPNTAESLA